MPSLMKQEILATPEHLKDTAKNAAAPIQSIVQVVKKQNIRHIFLAARGSSANAGLYFKYLCETLSGIGVSEIFPSVVTVYHRSVDMRGGLLIAISQGGRGVDIRLVAEEAKKQGVPTVAVTNFPESPLGTTCDYVLPLSVGLERSMAATKSFTSQLFALELLARALAQTVADVEKARLSFDAMLSRTEEIGKLCATYQDASLVYVLGRGKAYALAKEACCKLQETCLINAFPFSAADFMHGPLALAEKTSRVLLFHSRFASSESTKNLLSILNRQGADILLFTDDETVLSYATRSLLLESGSETETIFAMTAALQLFAAELSQLRSTDPDTSRNLNKYTETV